MQPAAVVEAFVEASLVASSPHMSSSHIVQVFCAQPCLALLHYLCSAVLPGMRPHGNIPKITSIRTMQATVSCTEVRPCPQKLVTSTSPGQESPTVTQKQGLI